MSKKQWDFIEVMMLCLLVGTIIAASIAYAEQPAPQPTPDLRSELMQPNDAVFQRYGFNPDTLLLFNVREVLRACMEYEVRIKALETTIKELTDKVAIQSEAIESLCRGMDAAGILPAAAPIEPVPIEPVPIIEPDEVTD